MGTRSAAWAMLFDVLAAGSRFESLNAGEKYDNCPHVSKAITAITSLLGHEHDPALPPMHDFHGLLQHLQDVQKFDCQNNVTSSSSVQIHFLVAVAGARVCAAIATTHGLLNSITRSRFD